MVREEIEWWKKEIIYQVYPRSFCDSNNDGIGDLKGIIARLDYLKWLGIGAIWISPVYPSPMADFGYDISDYTGIHPIFGTMEDFDALLQEAQLRGMRVIMDLVPNHTSHMHPWFIESQSSRDNPKRNWYIWKDAKEDGSPPNNWISEFGGSGWQFDEKTKQYYYHTFLKEQPDLNWHNAEVREAFWEIMRFWLRKGVDGFRVDVLWYIIKDHLFRDNPVNPDWHEGLPDHDKLVSAFSCDQPYIHEVVTEMRKVVDEFNEKVIIGEIYLPLNKLVAYYGLGEGIHLPFNFHLISTPWKAIEINNLVANYEGVLPENGWPNWVLGNHDKPRLLTRIGKGQARNAAILLLTLRGTVTLYYGDEIGMMDVKVPQSNLRDPREFLEPGIGVGRDPQRTPMRWTNEKYGGFSKREPWLPMGDGVDAINVDTQKNDPDSLLIFYKKLIALRQQEAALCCGDYIPVGVTEHMICYERRDNSKEFIIALNLGNEPDTIRPHTPFKGKIELATDSRRNNSMIENEISLNPAEGVIIRKYPSVA